MDRDWSPLIAAYLADTNLSMSCFLYSPGSWPGKERLPATFTMSFRRCSSLTWLWLVLAYSPMISFRNKSSRSNVFESWFIR